MSNSRRLGRYAVRRRIGSGGFATVWLAYDDELDSQVAVKVLAENWTEDFHVRSRFVEEGRFLRKVESANVVSVYDTGTLEDGRPFLVMTYADQGTLAERLAVADQPLTFAESVHVIAQVGKGLSALHRRGVLHRDLKPANVLFRSSDDEVVAMVADLGLGKQIDVSSRLSMIAGTPTYAAPEQARGERLDERADEYALGVLAYQLLSGVAPYSYATLQEAANPGVPAPMVGVPSELDDVVRRSLALDRDDRYDDVPTFTAALVEALQSSTGETPAAPTPWASHDDSVDNEPASVSLGGAEQPTLAPQAPVVTRLPEATSPPAISQQYSLTAVNSGGDSGLSTGALPVVSTGAGPVTGSAGEAPRTGRRRRRLLALGLAGVVAGLVVGFVGQRVVTREVSVSNAVISVEVPRAWRAQARTDGWLPPGGSDKQPAVSAGDGVDWRTEGGNGIFVGVLPGSELPETLPRHESCAEVGEPVSGVSDRDPTMTVTSMSCPGVVVERVVQLSADRLLWVQVREDTEAGAQRLLESVRINGYD